MPEEATKYTKADQKPGLTSKPKMSRVDRLLLTPPPNHRLTPPCATHRTSTPRTAQPVRALPRHGVVRPGGVSAGFNRALPAQHQVRTSLPIHPVSRVTVACTPHNFAAIGRGERGDEGQSAPDAGDGRARTRTVDDPGGMTDTDEHTDGQLTRTKRARTDEDDRTLVMPKMNDEEKAFFQRRLREIDILESGMHNFDFYDGELYIPHCTDLALPEGNATCSKGLSSDVAEGTLESPFSYCHSNGTTTPFSYCSSSGYLATHGGGPDAQRLSPGVELVTNTCDNGSTSSVTTCTTPETRSSLAVVLKGDSHTEGSVVEIGNDEPVRLTRGSVG